MTDQLAISEGQKAKHYRLAIGNFAALQLKRLIVVSRLHAFVISISPLSSRLKWRDLFDLIVIDFSTALRFGRNDRGNFTAPRFNRHSLIANVLLFAICYLLFANRRLA